jgi:hypothetical protein
MKNITSAEAIQHFKDYSESSLSSFNFSSINGDYKFRPSNLTRNFVGIFYIAALFLPHVFHFNLFLDYGLQSNNIVYTLFTVFGVLFTFLLANYLTILEVTINSDSKEILISPKDYIGQFIKKKTILKIDDILEIKYNHIERYKGKNINYVYILTKTKNEIKLFDFEDWDNVSKMTAAFSSLVYNQTTSYQDSE